MANEYSWYSDARSRYVRLITKNPKIGGSVYLNAYDNATWVGRIENVGYGQPFYADIKFNFRTAASAKKWIDGQVGKVRRTIARERKALRG